MRTGVWALLEADRASHEDETRITGLDLVMVFESVFDSVLDAMVTCDLQGASSLSLFWSKIAEETLLAPATDVMTNTPALSGKRGKFNRTVR